MYTTTRRDLLKLTAATAGVLATASLSLAQEGVIPREDQVAQPRPPQENKDDVPVLPTPESVKRGDMLYRKLGATGVEVSLLGLGGSHIGNVKSQDDATKLIRSAVDRGLTFMDNCWDYHNGRSEEWMGNALKDGYRDKVFLMTKIDGRTKDAAAKQIDESLKRLRTDHVDLMQYHEILRMEDPDRIFADGGAHEAMMDAKKAGKVRFVGFTGHKDPVVHLRMLQIAQDHDFKFDTVQMPLNVMDAHFRSFAHLVVPLLVKQNIGVLGMKSMGSGIILQSHSASPIECLHYAMNLPTSVVITGIDSPKILDQAFEAARTFHPLTHDEVAAILAKTRQPALTGNFEKFKTSTMFDGTAHNPQWLG